MSSDLPSCMRTSIICRHFSRAASTYDSGASIQRELACSLAHSVTSQAGHLAWPRILEIGCGTGFLTRELSQLHPAREYWVNDISEAMLRKVAPLSKSFPSTQWKSMLGDAEHLIWPNGLDAVVSSSAVQWFSNPLSVIPKSANALTDRGLLAICTFLPEPVEKSTNSLGKALRYPCKQEWLDSLSKGGFDVTSCRTKQISLVFDSPKSVLHHMQQTGVNSVTTTTAWTTTQLRTFSENYIKRFGNSSGVSLTYETLSFVAIKTR